MTAASSKLGNEVGPMEEPMKKILFCALLFCLPLVFNANVLASPYLNFAGVNGINNLSSPFTITTCLSPVNCSSNPVLTPMTVTFQAFGGSGTCVTGQCSGMATSVFETFSTPAEAFALFSAPGTNPTTVTYYLHGSQVGPTQVQLGGMYNLQKSAHTVFDTVEFSWSTPTNYSFYQGSFDAVPEPSSLLLLGSGLAGLVGLARRKLS
jgi:hypothetical protein